ncbi:MAG TPA: glycosyl hydrolase family 28-related protein [Humisphaera sp.]
MTHSTSRPPSTSSITSRWAGRKSSSPKMRWSWSRRSSDIGGGIIAGGACLGGAVGAPQAGRRNLRRAFFQNLAVRSNNASALRYPGRSVPFTISFGGMSMFTTPATRATALFVFALLSCATRVTAAPPPPLYVPADANLINVRDHGVKGDGVTDDTAALQRVVSRSLNDHRTLYFPAGTYLVSDTIRWANARGEFWPWLTWRGQGRDHTVIRLKEKSAGFADPANPKPVVMTGCYDGRTRQNASHGCYFFDLAVSVGPGNGGAIALDYISHNTGAVVNVRLTSEDGYGRAGLGMTRDSPGPALVRNLEVRGFDYGVELSNLLFSMTFDGLVVKHQRKAGVLVKGNMACIRALESANDVPAVRLEGWAAGAAIDGADTFAPNEKDVPKTWAADRPPRSKAAIEMVDAPTLVLRRAQMGISYPNWVARVEDGKRSVVPAGEPMGLVDHVIGERFALFVDPARAAPLNLEQPIGPERPDRPVPADHWASVAAFGAKADGKADDAEAVQRAIDSGRRVVYFPRGSYRFGKPVIVRGKVELIAGFSSRFDTNKGTVLFRFENDRPVALEQFNFFGGGKVELAGKDDVAIRYVTGIEHDGLRFVDGAPQTLFLDDVCVSHFTVGKGHRLFATQLNVEPEPPGVGFTNDGGTVRVIGLKTEFGNTIGVTRNGGRTEILGGLMLPAQGFRAGDTPAFVVEDAEFSGTWNEITFGGGVYKNVVRETRKGVTRTLKPQGEGTQRAWSLYSTRSE